MSSRPLLSPNGSGSGMLDWLSDRASDYVKSDNSPIKGSVNLLFESFGCKQALF
jgi:hypothetical protein